MLDVKGTSNFGLLLVTKKKNRERVCVVLPSNQTFTLQIFTSRSLLYTCRHLFLSYFQSENMANSDQSEQEDEGNVFEVEEIIQVVIPDHGKPLYEIKWKGYSSEW